MLDIQVLESETRMSPLRWFENQWTNRRALRNLDSAWEKCTRAVYYWKWWRRQIETIQDPGQFLMTTLACQVPTLAPLPLLQLPTRAKAAAVLRRVGSCGKQSCGKQSWDLALQLNGAYILKYKKEKLLLYSVTWFVIALWIKYELFTMTCVIWFLSASPTLWATTPSSPCESLSGLEVFVIIGLLCLKCFC